MDAARHDRNQTVSGVGFQPDALVHFHAGGIIGSPPMSRPAAASAWA